ncbi:uncharacterized protein Elp5 [Venturia canescens]|uniref:uncharacterized protein Elp5 n=1 Tax=Venturia canescens TaxID=32260 RepID=UPI001C9BC411|nr:uncharacterized protein LOC122406717 [Venturia canescens]
MAQIKTLPLFPGAKFIVIDDGQEVMRSQSLILGWLQMWNDKGLGNTVEFLLFSGPKFVYEKYTKNIKNVDLKLHDYYTVFVDDDKDDVAKLEGIVNGKILQVNSVVIVDCLSSLILLVGLSKALRFVEKLSSRCAQMICIYKRDFSQNKIPRIETLGTTYVRLEKLNSYTSQRDHIQYEVYLNHRKQGGGILHHRAHIFQEFILDTYEIVRETASNHSAPEIIPPAQHAQEKPQATFRIEMNAREQEQRKNTPLPYSQGATTQNESQILYEPDSIDDIDEEDPDDDLPF